jgi:hypothetical protein
VPAISPIDWASPTIGRHGGLRAIAATAAERRLPYCPLHFALCALPFAYELINLRTHELVFTLTILTIYMKYALADFIQRSGAEQESHRPSATA